MGAIVWGGPLVVLWAAGVAAIVLGARWWAAGAWDEVEVDARFDPRRAFAGEDVAVVVRIANAKRLPLPVVRIVVRLPDGLLHRADPAPTELRGHRLRLSLAGRSEVTIRLPTLAPKRGEYFLEPIEVMLADPFELAPILRRIEVTDPLIVFPHPADAVAPRVPRRLPFGAPTPSARLFEDREHFAGVREYEPGDPMNHVHWRLSAHTGRLQTKRYEPTRSAEVLIAVDVAEGEPFWYAVAPEVAETTIAWASLVARQAIHAGWRTGLLANTHLRRGRGPLRVPAAAASGREAVLFAALARMPAQPTGDLAPILREIGRRLPARSTVVVVSPAPGPSLLDEMHLLRRRGCEVLLVSPLASAWEEVS